MINDERGTEPCMATFVAPEGVYSLTSEHSSPSSSVSTPYPTRVSAALVPPGSDDNDPPSPTVPEQHSIFSPRPGKKSSARPKHNLRTSSSSFVTRIQSTDGWPKLLQSKHGIVAYNVAKSLVLVDGASRAKVWPVPSTHVHSTIVQAGASRPGVVFCMSYLPRHQPCDGILRPSRRRHRLQHRRYRLAWSVSSPVSLSHRTHCL